MKILVNHVRTLLLNLRPAVSPYPAGEEYVPPDFIPADLPQRLLDTREAIFGENQTRAGLNLLLARLLAYLHTSPLLADVTASDERITYDPNSPAPDADPESTTHNLLSAVDSVPESDRLFRTDRTTESVWFEYWQNRSLPGPLRAGALALALAARTEDVINGVYED